MTVSVQLCTVSVVFDHSLAIIVVGPVEKDPANGARDPVLASVSSSSAPLAPNPPPIAPPNPRVQSSRQPQAGPRSYRKSCSGYYVDRITAVDTAHRVEAEAASVEARREADNRKMVTVIWYEKVRILLLVFRSPFKCPLRPASPTRRENGSRLSHRTSAGFIRKMHRSWLNGSQSTKSRFSSSTVVSPAGSPCRLLRAPAGSVD